MAPLDRPAWPAQRHTGTGGGTWWSASRPECRRLHITAATPHGVVADHPHWPLLLDGILCWVDRRIMRHTRPGQPDRHRASMPLGVYNQGVSHRSIWLTSAGAWPAGVDIEPQPWGRRTDEEAHRQIAGHHGRINTSTGPDKSIWALDTVRLTGTVTWRAVGLADEVGRWLSHVCQIGDSASRGQGHVTGWQVDDVGPVGAPDDDLRWVTQWDDDLTVRRPVRPRWAPVLGHDGTTIPGSPLPPYVHPAHTSVGRRHDVPVLTPWGSRT